MMSLVVFSTGTVSKKTREENQSRPSKVKRQKTDTLHVYSIHVCKLTAFEQKLYEALVRTWVYGTCPASLLSPHRMHEMRTIVKTIPWRVRKSICLSRACTLQKRLNGSRSCLGWMFSGPRNIVLDGGPKPTSTGRGRDSMRQSPNYYCHLLLIALHPSVCLSNNQPNKETKICLKCWNYENGPFRE